MTRRSEPFSIAPAVLCLLLAAGCGGAAPTATARIAEPAPPPADEHLGRLLPGGAHLALRVDLEQLRRSQIWDVVRLIEDDEDLSRLERATGVALLATVDELLVVAAERMGRPDYAAFVVKGGFDAEEVVRRLLASEGGDAVELRGRPGATFDGMTMIALTPRTILAGTPAAMEDALAAVFDGAESLADDQEFAPVADSDDAVAVRFRRGTALPDFSGFDARRMPLDGIDNVVALDARVAVADGLSGSLVLTCATRLEASSLARDLRTTRRDFSRNPITLLLGIDWLLERIEIGVEGSAVEIAVSLDDNDLQQIRRLMERLEKIRALVGDSPVRQR